eukprot:gnl/TRDRNA2_/TRDRNA2_167677_c6_seq5.p1 gnl/TRDRNA2_/TRDRNA2_167677_c6~~gnl/TRDRNA2_/TRDRNA2_167677_c6_seq5.p1  ORF type:complete len:469 (+),score=71.69 gnl/TRDRNA2_/TRDRNA2_167677_c6_seq5:3-1409(+)
MVIFWIVRVYWTCDFPSQFLTGYNTKMGSIEFRPLKVGRRYLRTWMIFDLTLLLVDWTESLANMKAVRMGKTVKIMRLVRMVRLFRMKKIQEMMKQACLGVNSEEVMILFGIFSYICVVVTVIHVVGCIFYGIGDGEDGRIGWRQHYEIEKFDILSQYSVAMHWSMTQIIGSSWIAPQNTREHFFAVAVLLSSFVLSAAVVSSITSSMTRLHIIRAEESTMISMLNQYLRDNNISRQVAARVQRNAMYSLDQHKNNVPEANIVMLKYVSSPLRVELHYEIYKPTLVTYPFFNIYNERNKPGMKRVCHTALTILSLSPGDMLFTEGEVPPTPQMYFVLKGTMKYYQRGCLPVEVNVNQWASESVLWTPWMHVGRLRAKTEVNILVVDAEQFQNIAYQFQDAEFRSKKFGIAFVAALNKSDKSCLTDLSLTEFSVQDIVDGIWEVRRQQGSVKSMAGKKLMRKGSSKFFF